MHERSDRATSGAGRHGDDEGGRCRGERSPRRLPAAPRLPHRPTLELWSRRGDRVGGLGTSWGATGDGSVECRRGAAGAAPGRAVDEGQGLGHEGAVAGPLDRRSLLRGSQWHHGHVSRLGTSCPGTFLGCELPVRLGVRRHTVASLIGRHAPLLADLSLWSERPRPNEAALGPRRCVAARTGCAWRGPSCVGVASGATSSPEPMRVLALSFAVSQFCLRFSAKITAPVVVPHGACAIGLGDVAGGRCGVAAALGARVPQRRRWRSAVAARR